MIGREIHDFASLLWPIDRSITGEGVRATLGHIKARLPALKIVEVPSGSQVFDWTVPKEWKVREAWIIAPDGRRLCDFKENNLHLVGYSTPIKAKVTLQELQQHLYSLPEQPEAIPYITSYYKERWGFCISQKERNRLEDGEYEVCIDAELFDGSLSYGELILKGASEQEILLSTYVCHPSMANNELSGPAVTTFIAEWLSGLGKRRYSYRILFIPETIGSITYLSRHKDELKSRVVAGFNVTCIGDDRTYSYLPSRRGNTLSDEIAKHVLRHTCRDFKSYTWADRGSDERQYCAPGIDLPIASIMRSKYCEYDEYHTSLDDLEHVVTPSGLEGGYAALQRAIEALERNQYPMVTVFCEPQLGKRGLYPTLSTKGAKAEVRLMTDLITWSDGSRSLLEIADLCGAPIWELYALVDKLVEHGLLTLNERPSSVSRG